MKNIDSSAEGISHINWSPNGEWVSYVRHENEVCIANVSTGEIRVIGPGACPGITNDNIVVIERNDEIVAIESNGERIIAGINSITKNTPKRAPVLSPDGGSVAFVVNNVFDKESQADNAYPYRHFVAIAETKSNKITMTTDQWYGGTMHWFPNSERFVHFEYDSTGGAQLHVVNANGKSEVTVFGLYPSVSPDGRRIACKPRSGGNVVIYTFDDNWSKESINTVVMKIPESSQRLSATPPMWIDNRYVLVDDSGKIWRVDTRKDNSAEMSKLPQPTFRGTASWAISPSRDALAMEIANGDQFDLRIVPLT